MISDVNELYRKYGPMVLRRCRQILGNEERVEELARMLGGVEITTKTLEHAAEMLAGARQKRA